MTLIELRDILNTMEESDLDIKASAVDTSAFRFIPGSGDEPGLGSIKEFPVTGVRRIDSKLRLVIFGT